MTLRQKLVFLFLHISLLPIIFISIFVYSATKERVTEQVVSQLELIAQIQENRINTAIDQNLERLVTVSRRSALNEILVKENYQTTQKNLEIKKILEEAKSSIRSFNDILILDVDGYVIAATNPNAVGTNYENEEFFQKGRVEENVESFYLDENYDVRVYLSGPIHAQEDLVGIVVVIESDVENILSLIKDYSGLGKSGEILLARRDLNGNALFITPSRFHANAALRRIVSKNNRNEPITQALSKNEILLTNAVDYRGKRVLAATRYIDKSDWGLVVKIDEEEAFEPLKQLKDYFIYSTLITSVFAILTALYLAQNITNPIIQLTEVTSKIRQGDMRQKVNIKSNDEIGRLADSFNAMSNKLRKSYSSLEGKVSDKTIQLKKKIFEIQEQVAKDEALLESIGDGVIATDSRQKIILVNRAAAQMLGWQAKDMLGKIIYSVLKMTNSKGEAIPIKKNSIALSFKSESKITTIASDGLCFTSKKSTLLPAVFSATPIILGNYAIGTVVVFRDITHERDVDRMKTEFISLASHQLRTPLAAVKWFSQMLESGDAGKLNKEQLNFVNNISESNERMIDLTNNLLNINRIESGKIIINPKQTDFEKLVTETVNYLQNKVEKKELVWKIKIDSNLPKIKIDPKLIREVFINLLSNAIKYSKNSGLITVIISRQENLIISQITDEGYGIPGNEQKHVFQKFYRGANIVNEHPEGTGLGLYLVKAIIESSGGNIWFKSELGVGTTFWFSLPIYGDRIKRDGVSLIPSKIEKK